MDRFLSELLRFVRNLVGSSSRTRPPAELPPEVHFEHERSRGARGN